jgi:hypothetical protein
MHRLTAMELGVAAKEILKVPETSVTWNATLLAIREAGQLLKNLPAL